MKTCTKCNKEKELSDFPKDKSRKDGVYIYCKLCCAEIQREKYHSNIDYNRKIKRNQAIKNKESNRIRNKKWYEENKEQKKIYTKNYRLNNLKKSENYQKEWVNINKDKVKQNQKRYAQSEKGKKVLNQRNHNRKSKLKGAEGKHSLKEWEDLKVKHDFTCIACKRKEPEIKLTRDHKIPISKGGSNYIENIQPLCQSCNSRKKDKL